jgi:hypothetical protein
MMIKPYLLMFGLRQDIVNLTVLCFLQCHFLTVLSIGSIFKWAPSVLLLQHNSLLSSYLFLQCSTAFLFGITMVWMFVALCHVLR